jgi:hypothetical protein
LATYCLKQRSDPHKQASISSKVCFVCSMMPIISERLKFWSSSLSRSNMSLKTSASTAGFRPVYRERRVVFGCSPKEDDFGCGGGNSNELSSFKRRRLTDDSVSKSQSLAQSRPRAGEAELLRWLDQADKQDGPVFDILNPPIRKSVKRFAHDVSIAASANDHNVSHALSDQDALARAQITWTSSIGLPTRVMPQAVSTPDKMTRPRSKRATSERRLLTKMKPASKLAQV